MNGRISEKRIKAAGVFLFVVVILLFLVESGAKDMRDDRRYLIIFQSKGEPRAGVIFTTEGIFTSDGIGTAESGEEELINAFSLPSVSEKNFFSEAAKYKVDRVVVLNHEALKRLSSKPHISYKDSKVLVESAVSWISGYSWIPLGIVNEEERKKTEVGELNSELLAAWIDENAREQLTLKTGFGEIIEEYRKGNVIIYPENAALKILKFVPLEKAF